MRVSIPWKYLGTKVVVAELKQIHIILKIEEKSLLPVNAETYSEISKQASIAAAEIAKRSKVVHSANLLLHCLASDSDTVFWRVSILHVTADESVAQLL